MRRTGIAGTVLVAATAVALVYYETSRSLPSGRHPIAYVRDAGQTIYLTVAGVHASLTIPRNGATHRVVLYLHGAGQVAQSLLTDAKHAQLAVALLRHGYAIAGSDAGGEAWGSRESVRDYERLITHLRSSGLTQLYLLAESMGGLDGEELIGREPIRAWAALYPVCNVASITTYRDAISGVYRSLPRQLSPVRMVGARNLQMVFWASARDRVVPKATNTDVCAAEARAEGARVTVISTRGNHGDVSNFQPTRLLRAYAHGTRRAWRTMHH